MPIELVLENAQTAPALLEVQQEGRLLLVEPQPGGQGKLVRLISSDPSDYLNPSWQPGTLVQLGVH